MRRSRNPPAAIPSPVSENPQTARLDRRLLARLGEVLGPYKGWVALAVLLTVAVAALGEAHEAAERQPVQRVERLAAAGQDLGPGRKPDPELQDADPRQARHREVPDLVDEDEPAEDQEEQQDRAEALDEGHHAGPRKSPVA